jgi:hypothetical protein
MQRSFTLFMQCVASCLILLTLPAQADEQQVLRQLLDQFLQGASHDVQQHDRFWAEDLIYTSSTGQRFGKAKIMTGMQAEAEKKSATPPSTRYWAEDVEIKLYGTTAIVAFKLMGEMQEDGEPVLHQYLNTGTFLKRNNQWRAVAWQATKIP